MCVYVYVCVCLCVCVCVCVCVYTTLPVKSTCYVIADTQIYVYLNELDTVCSSKVAEIILFFVNFPLHLRYLSLRSLFLLLTQANYYYYYYYYCYSWPLFICRLPFLPVSLG